MLLMEQEISNLHQGVEIIRKHLEQLPVTPGVYRMLGGKGEALYVGKAKALKKRVASYTQISKLPERLKRMVALTRDVEFVHTHTEAEALLLESNLIKELKPSYNILLRDDKSFAHILITNDHDFPLVIKHRGAQKRKGSYYGPFAGAGDVNRTLAILQRIFRLRNCSNSTFAARKRPCLQYQIERCSAPCVGFVSKEDYAAQVDEARAFLNGDSRAVQERMALSMQQASDAQDYELAARYRDQISALTSIQAHQDINVQELKNVDVMALAQEGGQSCIQVFFFRGGANYGNRSYFPRHDKDEEEEEILSAFIAQFYENKPVPKEVLVSHAVSEHGLLEEALSLCRGQKVKISKPIRGGRRRVVEFAVKNAAQGLKRHMAEKAGELKLLQEVSELFDLQDLPRRIEVYDNSHISGTNMVGGMIVAGPDGFNKKAYRKFNIKQAGAGDDYAMMREVLGRRFKHCKPSPQSSASRERGDYEDWPDLIIIDGGAGQLSAVKGILEELGIWECLHVVSIAKGPDRNAGREKFFMEGRAVFQLPENDPVLHYLQRLRDEAHRFAIGAHRAQRSKDISKSPLDEISGVGAARKKALLHHFGSGKAVAGAGLEDLEKVEGISKALAQKIYEWFHEG